METIKEILKSVWETVQNALKALSKEQTKRLAEENYYTYRPENYKIVPETEIGESEYLGEIETGTFQIAGLSLPIGSFEIKGNTISVKEKVTITPDGKMYMRGKEICTNEKMQTEIARQIKQNGKPSGVVVDGNGDIVKTESEKYRNEMYDDEARKKTEEVSANWKEKQEEREAEKEEKKETENHKGDER